MLFSERLRTLINDRALTQKQLALELKIPVSTLGGYVQGTSEPDFDTLKLIANYFNVTADFLLDFRSENAVSSDEDELLTIFRSLNENQKSIYLEQGKAFIKHNK